MPSIPDDLIKIGPPTNMTTNQEDTEEEEIIEPTVLFINEETLSKSPQITVSFDKQLAVPALLDSGSEVNIISQEIFDKLNEIRADVLTLPVQGINLVTAFRKRSKKVKLQTMLEFNIGSDRFEAVFLVSPQLNNDVILGCSFLREYKMHLCFDTGTLRYECQGRTRDHLLQADNANTAPMPEASAGNSQAASINKQFSESEATASCSTMSHTADKRHSERDAGPRQDLNMTELTRYSERSDPRSMNPETLQRVLDNSEVLNTAQKSELFEVLSKYLPHMTAKPSKCNLFKYEFKVQSDKPIRSFSRPVPFELRPAVKAQIQEMLNDDILELSYSDVLNPLTVVLREGKKPRICVDARKINQATIPDYERTPPLQELLQKFEGAKYLSSLDLSSAYLQVELNENSRKYTAFLYDSVVYQYKRLPYGFKNSLPAFMRALHLALGNNTEDFVTAYVDDILIHFEDLRGTPTAFGLRD
jgi:hypothetical protein